jgi:adenylate cyclase
MTADDPRPIALSEIAACFEGIVPAEIATASSAGVPNVTHLSRVHMVDDERVALSNQFFSKTTRNLAENPHACVVVVDPTNYDCYRMMLVYERTERRGPVFERLRRDIDVIAGLTGMEGIFKLRSADIYRVAEIEQVPAAVDVAQP